MIAFVLSGAGSRGAIEVGALQALLEHEIQPDFFVGTSAGALNAVYLSGRGVSLETTGEMPALWASATAHAIYPGNIINVAWRVLAKRDSLYPNDGMSALIRRSLPRGVETFADLTLPVYTTAVDLQTSRLFVFGDKEPAQTPLHKIILASASMPPIHPPVDYHNLQLIDGGILASVPADIAIQKGATDIYVLNAGYSGAPLLEANGLVEVIGHTLRTMQYQAFLQALDHARSTEEIRLHNIYLQAFKDLSFRDFSKTNELVEAGYTTTKAYLKAPMPQAIPPRAEGEIALPQATVRSGEQDKNQDLESLPPGAEEYRRS